MHGTIKRLKIEDETESETGLKIEGGCRESRLKRENESADFTRYRKVLGGSRPLIESPGHLDAASDREDAVSIIASARLFLWDYDDISSSGRDALPCRPDRAALHFPIAHGIARRWFRSHGHGLQDHPRRISRYGAKKVTLTAAENQRTIREIPRPTMALDFLVAVQPINRPTRTLPVRFS